MLECGFCRVGILTFIELVDVQSDWGEGPIWKEIWHCSQCREVTTK